MINYMDGRLNVEDLMKIYQYVLTLKSDFKEDFADEKLLINLKNAWRKNIVDSSDNVISKLHQEVIETFHTI
jgi:transcriptional regulator NrdR family protein